MELLCLKKFLFFADGAVTTLAVGASILGRHEITKRNKNKAAGVAAESSRFRRGPFMAGHHTAVIGAVPRRVCSS